MKWVPAAVLAPAELDALTPTAVRLYGLLAVEAGRGNGWPDDLSIASYRPSTTVPWAQFHTADVAHTLGCSENSAGAALTQLAALGLVRVQRRKGRASLWQIVLVDGRWFRMPVGIPWRSLPGGDVKPVYAVTSTVSWLLRNNPDQVREYTLAELAEPTLSSRRTVQRGVAAGNRGGWLTVAQVDGRPWLDVAIHFLESVDPVDRPHQSVALPDVGDDRTSPVCGAPPQRSVAPPSGPTNEQPNEQPRSVAPPPTYRDPYGVDPYGGDAGPERSDTPEPTPDNPTPLTTSEETEIMANARPSYAQPEFPLEPDPLAPFIDAAGRLTEALFAAAGGRRSRADYPTDEAWGAQWAPFLNVLRRQARDAGHADVLDSADVTGWEARIGWSFTLGSFWTKRFGTTKSFVAAWTDRGADGEELRSKWEAHLDEAHRAAQANGATQTAGDGGGSAVDDFEARFMAHLHGTAPGASTRPGSHRDRRSPMITPSEIDQVIDAVNETRPANHPVSKVDRMAYHAVLRGYPSFDAAMAVLVKARTRSPWLNPSDFNTEPVRSSERAGQARVESGVGDRVRLVPAGRTRRLRERSDSGCDAPDPDGDAGRPWGSSDVGVP